MGLHSRCLSYFEVVIVVVCRSLCFWKPGNLTLIWYDIGTELYRYCRFTHVTFTDHSREANLTNVKVLRIIVL